MNGYTKIIETTDRQNNPITVYARFFFLSNEINVSIEVA